MRPEPEDRHSQYREARQRILAIGRELAADFDRWRESRAIRRTPRVRRPGTDADLDTSRTYRTPVEQAEAEDGGQELKTERGRVRLSAVWRREVGPAPSCQPGDHDTAKQYLDKLESILDHHATAETLDDGTTPLTRAEQGYLRRQIVKWRRRAEGRDSRFNLYGTKSGRTPRTRVWGV